VYASKTRKEKFSGRDGNCPQNVSGLEDSLVTSSRPSGLPQKRPGDRTSNDGVAAQTADGSQQTAGATDEQCPRCGCSNLVVPCAADIGGNYKKWTGVLSNLFVLLSDELPWVKVQHPVSFLELVRPDANIVITFVALGGLAKSLPGLFVG